jgi:hypothetical protein
MTRSKILFGCDAVSARISMLLVVVFTGSIIISPLLSQSAAQAKAPTPGPAPANVLAQPQSARPVAAGSSARYQPDRFAGRAGKYYSLVWGVEALSVKSVESGELIRFSYHVLDGEKAKPINDKKAEPGLIDPVHHIKLVIPSLEKVGQLRQSGTPEAGRSYWMAFSNPHRDIKRGDRVNVVIGQFHADGLVVE